MWYEGRWGIITGLEGHSEALDIYNSKGKLVETIASPISGQTGDLALDVTLAVGGKGTYYLMDGSSVYVYSADGKFQNKFAVYGADGEQMSPRSNLVVDGQGNLYIADSQQMALIDSNGRTIKSFPTQNGADHLALDMQDHLWAITRTKVEEYVKTGF